MPQCSAPFCTCKDKKCPLNPMNHDRGCTLCIAKCLKDGEIPSCFFVAVSGHSDQGSYTYLDFAHEVERHA